MPELPEVELVVRGLEAVVKGRHILRADLLRQRLSPDVSPDAFDGALAGAAIRFVHRRGKHILFDLDNEKTLIAHLRMSGRFLLLGGDTVDPKFTHAVLHFTDNERLVFQDQRHFGLMKIVSTPDLKTAREIAKLAPEPLSTEFSPAFFLSSLRSSRRSLKEFLLDQTKVCGLGNIYAAEALFLAGVHPAKMAARLSAKRAGRLFNMIREVLQEAIDAGSTLNTDPSDPRIGYYGGEYESYWRVYGRQDLPCRQCGSAILRVKQAGRSSFFCPTCQTK